MIKPISNKICLQVNNISFHLRLEKEDSRSTKNAKSPTAPPAIISSLKTFLFAWRLNLISRCQNC